jgi:hypothetical protein
VPVFWAKPDRYALTYYRHKVYMYYTSGNCSIGSTKLTLKAEKISYPTESFAYLQGQPSDLSRSEQQSYVQSDDRIKRAIGYIIRLHIEDVVL